MPIVPIHLFQRQSILFGNLVAQFWCFTNGIDGAKSSGGFQSLIFQKLKCPKVKQAAQRPTNICLFR